MLQNKLQYALVNPPAGSYDKVYYSMKTGVHATCDLAFAGYTETVPKASDVTTEGSYTICSYVTDTAETIKDFEPNPITFEYDATAPTVVTALNITEPARYKGSSITANWDVSVDPSASILKQTVQLYKGSSSCTTPYGAAIEVSNAITSRTLNVGADDDYSFNVTNYDLAGNPTVSLVLLLLK